MSTMRPNSATSYSDLTINADLAEAMARLATLRGLREAIQGERRILESSIACAAASGAQINATKSFRPLAQARIA